MSSKSYQKYLNHLKTASPLVLCLTNTVTITECANALLAIGAAPVMSEDPADAASLALLASSLVINIGTINDRSQAVMEAAAQAALNKGIPVILDPVGAGASLRRMEASKQFLKVASVIRGNASEILALTGHRETQRGVDSSAKTEDDILLEKASQLALDTKAVVAVSGPVDLITDGNTVIKIEGGTPLLTRLTGTGCMLSAIVGAYIGGWPTDQLLATAAAHIHLARAGEKAKNRLDRHTALGSFKTFLFDELAMMEGSDLDEKI
ncbi:MAG: hydroxyethylthiazole kinase [Deltaproteobacteria bacterium]|jgi:hydroxyethylthiazole kinase|nr:hydroxyethylthiazole kinase [Deltaproteobacteria bacterium]